MLHVIRNEVLFDGVKIISVKCHLLFLLLGCKGANYGFNAENP